MPELFICSHEVKPLSILCVLFQGKYMDILLKHKQNYLFIKKNNQKASQVPIQHPFSGQKVVNTRKF